MNYHMASLFDTLQQVSASAKVYNKLYQNADFIRVREEFDKKGINKFLHDLFINQLHMTYDELVIPFIKNPQNSRLLRKRSHNNDDLKRIKLYASKLLHHIITSGSYIKVVSPALPKHIISRVEKMDNHLKEAFPHPEMVTSGMDIYGALIDYLVTQVTSELLKALGTDLTIDSERITTVLGMVLQQCRKVVDYQIPKKEDVDSKSVSDDSDSSDSDEDESKPPSKKPRNE